MSDPGFPPFRSAQPKGTKPTTTTTNAPRPSETEEQTRARDRTTAPVEISGDYMGDLTEPPVQHITVCAKCGSREVREAVLIGDEVYVKL